VSAISTSYYNNLNFIILEKIDLYKINVGHHEFHNVGFNDHVIGL